ncbi:ferritin-like metal-binding protein YciE [Pseudorhizobium tarimense]|uniref:Ferritin-like metal-binding protein YciE n=1 Tax=Pseudorhizobium tarimense TaxID=1079109 RepID=A0ABV2H902_9HYPH|nr:ferritin-like domain-containing protein [Pseudorhizobium tarimense]MCJ8520092.1 ferritin-like domain-containing protein [Pseudorhizobium tarimense]
MADTSATREVFVSGLKNAHAMENQALSIMKPQLSRIENYPEVARRLEEHIHETEGQMSRIEELLQQLEESHSSVKDMALSLTGGMAAMGHTVAGDEILKNSFANYAFEHFEIAAYKSLLTVAQVGGFSFATSALQMNLQQEEDMAKWIDDNLRSVTTRYIDLREAGESAKV